MNWDELATKVIEGYEISREEALAVAGAPDSELLAVLQAAYRVRAFHHGNKVRLHVLQNAKSGVCPEDCAFCSQSLKYNSKVDQYGMQSVEELLEGARKAYEKGAVTYCMVTATRGPVRGEIDRICDAVRQIKEKYPLKVCASLGILKEGQAEALAAAGVDRYNHNIETSERHFPELVSTHSFADRVRTVTRAKEAGLEACCGGILGMGEQREDWVDMALTLRDLEVESVPVNFLNPRPGTPMGEHEKLRPQDCLKALAMFRLVHPASDVRIAGGREVVLGTMQPLALFAANSFFVDGYLTTGGQGESKDAVMIREAGFEAEVVNAS